MATETLVQEQPETNVRRWSRVADTKKCPRCGGLMVLELCMDLLDDTGQIDFSASRCVLCGELIDPVILANRRRQRLNGTGMSAWAVVVLGAQERS